MYGIIGGGSSGMGRLVQAMSMMVMACEMNSMSQSETFTLHNFHRSDHLMPLMAHQVSRSSSYRSRSSKRTPMNLKQRKARKATKAQRQARKVNR